MKLIATKINKFITIITNIIESCISALSEDMLLLTFLIAMIIPNAIIKYIAGMSLFNLRSLIFNLAWYGFIVALGYNYKRKRTRLIYFFLISTFVYILTYANSLYFRNYSSFMSLSLIKQIPLFKSVAGATSTLLRPLDIIYWVLYIFAMALMIILTNSRLNKANYQNIKLRILNRKKFLWLALICFASGIFTLAPANYSQAVKLWNRPIVVEDFGLYNYHLLDLYKSMDVFIKHKPTQTDYKEFLNYYDERDKEDQANPNTTNEYTDVLQNQNLIIIHAESLEHFLINAKVPDVDGNMVEVTPYFNKLANEGLYFNNFYSQQSVGTSADSEFVFNSSLLPVNNGTVYLTNFDNTYVTTQTLLQKQGYLTLYMHGNNATFWNRNVMYPVMGYDAFYSKKTYSFTDKDIIGLGISDYQFFQQSAQRLANASQPYLATLITLSNHTPWNDVDKYITYDSKGNEEPAIDCSSMNLDGTTLCRYLKSVHYADWAFGQFWNTIEQMGLLDNAAIVVYGDHPASLPIDDMDTYLGYQEDKPVDMTRIEYEAEAHVPFIIWDHNIQPKEINEIMGEYDVGPTLQNMLGIDKNPYALGHDIFSISDNIVPFVNGSWTDGIVYYDYYKNDYYIMDPSYSQDKIDQMIKNDDYLNKQMERANGIINISNMINKFDLIAYNEAKVAEQTTTTSKKK